MKTNEKVYYVTHNQLVPGSSPGGPTFACRSSENFLGAKAAIVIIMNCIIKKRQAINFWFIVHLSNNF